jgi:predicted 2-oxoglutarate/Fe(II)-dependent dioxygenase YbiX
MSQPYTLGEQVPSFHARSAANPRFAFDTLGGRWVLVLVPGPLGDEGKASAVAGMIERWPEQLTVARAILLVIGTDPADERAGRLADGAARRVLWDDDGAARRALRATAPDGILREGWLLLDPTLRVFAAWPLAAGAEAMATLAALPEPGAHAGVAMHAPVLIVPRIFEPAFCRRLIALYEEQGGGESGFMRDVGGKTVGILDGRHKRRKDAVIEDEALQAQMRARISARLLPQIRRAFQFNPTRIERYIVACYDEADRGFFAAHRDNTTRGTAHRRFAVTINLNTGEYEGGELCFPEYGPQTYVAPAGGAVVFSCSLLHEARPVTKGVRYASLPFLYDEDAAKVRAENLRFLGNSGDASGAQATGG